MAKALPERIDAAGHLAGRPYLAAIAGLRPGPWEELSGLLEELSGESRSWALAARYASTMPRRLGVDATVPELSRDKKVARKVAHAYHLLHLGLDSIDATLGTLPEGWEELAEAARGDDAARRVGSALDFPTFLRDRVAGIEKTMGEVGAWAVDRGEYRPTAKVAYLLRNLRKGLQSCLALYE